MNRKNAKELNRDEEILRLRREVIELKDALSRERCLRLDSEERAHLAAERLDRAEAESALPAGEERFKRLLQNSNDIIAVLDGNSLFISISGPSERILGHVPEALIGKPSLSFVHPDDLESTKQVFFELADTPGAVRSAEFRYRHANGNWITIEAVGTNLLNDPVVKGITLNVRDISRRKKLEDQLQQARKMEAIGVLAGGIAHDFNNILNVINGYSELLLADFEKSDPRHEDLMEIQKAGKRAAALTSQLLAFSRKQMIQPVILDLKEVLDGMTLMLHRVLGEDVEMRIVTPPNGGMIQADPGQIQQIILNLALNARDAMPHGGKLTIETADAYFDDVHIQAHPALQPGPCVILAISDNGVGMNATTLSHLFEPFFTTKPKGKGTGLGLSTVYGIVNQSGGAIWVYSEPGQGTTFKICFPQAKGQAARIGCDVKRSIQPRGSETVLVAEDESAVRALAARILRSQGYTVLDAANGKEALDIARSYAGSIQMILTDVVMPGMSGRELVNHLEAVRPGIKSLFVSGYAANAIVHHGVLDSDVAFLPKPFSSEDLTRKVREILDS